MSVMYLGPDFPGIVKHNQTYTYRPDKVIQEAAAIEPLAAHFFVNMDSIVTKKNELRTKGSFLNLCYKEILKRR